MSGPNKRAKMLVLGLTCALTLAATATTATTVGAQDAPARLYFFSPDWRPGDLNGLTARVQSVLGDEGINLSFQAFTRYEDFLSQVRSSPPDFIIAPAWFEDTAKEEAALPLRAIARPTRHGRSTYRKALMTRPEVDSIDDLTDGSIAATVHSMGPGSERVVLDAFHLDADSAKVVPVPKDVDALLALSFGQVDGALVTAPQYDLLAESNPAVAEKLQVLAFSPDIPLPAVYATPRADAGVGARLVIALAGFSDTERGAEILKMLGYDGFTTADGSGQRPATRTTRPQPAPVLGSIPGAIARPDGMALPAGSGSATDELMGPPLPPSMRGGR